MRRTRLLATFLLLGCARANPAQMGAEPHPVQCVVVRPATREDAALARAGVGALVIRIDQRQGEYDSMRGLEVLLRGDTLYRLHFPLAASMPNVTGPATVEFPAVRPGEYRVRVHQFGYHADSLLKGVVAGRRDTLEFHLRVNAAADRYLQPPPCAHHAAGAGDSVGRA